MKKLKVYLLFSLIIFSGVSLQAQVKVKDLNAILTSGSAIPGVKDNPEQLKKAFFDAHGQITVVDGKAVLWDRADKPVENMILNSVSEIQILKSAFADKIFLIRTIRVKLGQDMSSVAALANEMPNLQNILLVSEKPMPQNIDQGLSDFLNGLAQNQINPVSVYYYQESQPQ